MRKEVESTTKLELQVIHDRTVLVQGEEVKLSGRKDAAALVLISCVGNTIISEEVIAITLDVHSFLKLLSFARADGGITVHRDLRI